MEFSYSSCIFLVPAQGWNIKWKANSKEQLFLNVWRFMLNIRLSSGFVFQIASSLFLFCITIQNKTKQLKSAYTHLYK